MEQIEKIRNALQLALRDYLDNLESGHSISIKGQTPCIEALQALDELENGKEVTYMEAKSLGFTNIDRWGEGLAHHKRSISLYKFLEQHDLQDYEDSFSWKAGGDGDNGETLMYQLDAYFETQAAINVIESEPIVIIMPETTRDYPNTIKGDSNTIIRGGDGT